MNYDIIIIGTGPGGANAALYAARGGLNVVMIEKENPGGKIVTSATVENWLGTPTISGYDLGINMLNHAKEYGAKVIMGEVLKINSHDLWDKEVLLANGKSLRAKSIIIATGLKHREPTFIKNYYQYKHLGVHFCATCDAPLYRDENVVMLGGGNSAVEEAIFASRFVSHVDLIVLNELTADKILIDAIKEVKNITIHTHSEILELVGNDKGFTKIIVRNNIDSSEKEIQSRALFSLIGFIPDNSIYEHLNIVDKQGFIQVNEEMETKVENIFAVGDIIVKKVRQLVTAAADGCIAAKTLIDKLNLN
ncbi:FAD-dependent oxidoreductase [Mycoplasma sp. ES3157-GEN-MYC]|uniref:FAD-dependent oxidoreductase n=1 Tax=Mycoplasma miroungigenitalium TaxID=754515 RepID=A0A6M4JCC1_9MOLU|nr:FAD-dependent oxidoreductase [Mycoplasma miroungigenitalium]MBU4690548.1 FAD-dependent oxidoreductase [Mycoplasma miroungigenitalium]MBU4691815.1 FAD-dependent oxidoreductase [Mycoplasma miroungigenitalium]QJR43676.1 FAD-dependent oxidoreductase [Mycoplasma miroungigenitalium]